LPPQFVEIHGLSIPAAPRALPQTFAAPYRGRSARLYEFLLPADTVALQRVCDTLFTAPSRGAWRFEPLMPLVLLTFLDAVQLSATDRPASDIGWFKERDAVFWFLALATNRATGTSSVCGVPLYAFVDQPQALLTGREVHGWPKESAALTLDLTAAGGFERLVVSTTGMRDFGADVPAASIDVLRIGRVPGSDGVTATNVLASVEDALRLAWDVGGAAFALLHPRVFADVLAELRGGAVPLALLKQFRDASDGTTACYQAIISAPVRATRIGQGGILPGSYLVELPPAASHPIADDLGLDVQALAAVKGFWLDFDFIIEAGTELWKAE
jgi:hypothetical protein